MFTAPLSSHLAKADSSTAAKSLEYFLLFKSRKADVQRVQVTYAKPQSTDTLCEISPYSEVLTQWPEAEALYK